MSFHEKRALVSLASTLLLAVVYTSIMWARIPTGDPYSPEVFRFWGLFFVVYIPIVIVAKIVLYIVFSILNAIATREGDPGIEDERDKLIELRANRNSAYVFGLGFIIAMFALVFNQPPTTMFLILVGGGLIAESTAEVWQFLYYRRGF